MGVWDIVGLAVAGIGLIGALFLPRRDAPALTGPPLVLCGVGLGVLGALLGIVSAFWVPFGVRIGVQAGPVATESGGGGGASGLLAAGGEAYGTLLSVGVAMAFGGCLLLGVLARRATGGRLVALVPVSVWLLVALLALSQHHESLVLPAEVTPGIAYLYAGVFGGAISLLPSNAVAVLTRRRA